MISIIAGSCLMIASSYIGMGIFSYYKMRTKFYADFLLFIQFISNEINYAKSNLYEIIDAFNSRHDANFSKITAGVKGSLERGEEIAIKTNYLNAVEKKELQVFFRTITRLDRGGLASFFAREQARINAKISLLKEEEGKNGQLAKSLGILIGIGLLIVVI